MVRPMPSSAPAPRRVRDRFRTKAKEFDDLYEDERPLVRLLRPGLFRRRELAVETRRSYSAPSVLDGGCVLRGRDPQPGAGRIAGAGAAERLAGSQRIHGHARSAAGRCRCLFGFGLMSVSLWR